MICAHLATLKPKNLWCIVTQGTSMHLLQNCQTMKPRSYLVRIVFQFSLASSSPIYYVINPFCMCSHGWSAFSVSKSVPPATHNKIMELHWVTSNSKKKIECRKWHNCCSFGYRFILALLTFSIFFFVCYTTWMALLNLIVKIVSQYWWGRDHTWV